MNIRPFNPRITTLAAVGIAAAALFVYMPRVSLASSPLLPAGQRKVAAIVQLKDAGGKDVTLSEYKGQVVLLTFWATWCGPCKVEVPWFNEFEDKFKNSGFAVIGVSMDEDGWQSVRPFVVSKPINYRVVIGDDAIAGKFGGVDSLPETVLIDRRGRIAAHHIGLVGKAAIAGEIEQLLKEAR